MFATDGPQPIRQVRFSLDFRQHCVICLQVLFPEGTKKNIEIPDYYCRYIDLRKALTGIQQLPHADGISEQTLSDIMDGELSVHFSLDHSFFCSERHNALAEQARVHETYRRSESGPATSHK